MGGTSYPHRYSLVRAVPSYTRHSNPYLDCLPKIYWTTLPTCAANWPFPPPNLCGDNGEGTARSRSPVNHGLPAKRSVAFGQIKPNSSIPGLFDLTLFIRNMVGIVRLMPVNRHRAPGAERVLNREDRKYHVN